MVTKEHIERTTETKRSKDPVPGTWERIFRRGNNGLPGCPTKYLLSACFMSPVVEDLDSTPYKADNLEGKDI